MLWVCTDVTQFNAFKKTFRDEHASLPWMDVSTVPLNSLLDQCESILAHHPSACVFLGYLEPGWMLEPTHQTRMRSVFRKYPVGIVLHFSQSLPFSWKNEIEVVYPVNPSQQHGDTRAIDDGGAVHDQPKV